MGVNIEIDQSFKYVDEGLANGVIHIDVAVNSLPCSDTPEAVRAWIELADFRHLPPRVFRQAVESAVVKLVEINQIDYSKLMHEISVARFGKHRGEKFAAAFDYMLKAKEA